MNLKSIDLKNMNYLKLCERTLEHYDVELNSALEYADKRHTTIFRYHKKLSENKSCIDFSVNSNLKQNLNSANT